MRERVVLIGQPQPLVGIICEPEHPVNPKLGVILLNSGVIHRVGSCRLSVTLARNICEQAGLLCLRFDFSGIGDSEARRGTLTAAEVAAGEVREAMDFLARDHQITHFILYGLCSGAYASYRTALQDPRVVGIAQIDGYCYLSWQSYLHHYLPRLFNLTGWRKRLNRWLGRGQLQGAAVSGIETRFFEVPNFGDFPPREEVTAGFAQLNQRGLQLFNVFCRSEHYNYANQFRDCFRQVPFGANLSLLYLPNASHILAEPDDQQRVVAGITTWVKGLAAKFV